MYHRRYLQGLRMEKMIVNQFNEELVATPVPFGKVYCKIKVLRAAESLL